MRNFQDIPFISTQTYREFFKSALVSSSLCRRNLNRVILAQVNINSLPNKFDILAEGIKMKVDVLIISETKPDETLLDIILEYTLFYIEGLTDLADLIETSLGVYIYLVYVKGDTIFRLS